MNNDEVSTSGLAKWLRTDHVSVRKLRRNGIIPFRPVQKGTRVHYYFNKHEVLRALEEKFN